MKRKREESMNMYLIIIIDLFMVEELDYVMREGVSEKDVMEKYLVKDDNVDESELEECMNDWNDNDKCLMGDENKIVVRKFES